MQELAKVTRFEVIDHTERGNGRVFVKYGNNLKLETSSQDQDRTLKLFVTNTKSPIPISKYETRILYAINLIKEVHDAEPSEYTQAALDSLADLLDSRA